MNKAFIKEPDDTGEGRCPRCGSLACAVGPATLEAQLSVEDRRGLAESAFFCPFARCDVAYFDMFERVVLANRLLRPAWPKDADAPVCGCFGLTAAEIEEDVRAGSVSRVREVVARAKSSLARCTTMSASGQCCVGQV